MHVLWCCLGESLPWMFLVLFVLDHTSSRPGREFGSGHPQQTHRWGSLGSTNFLFCRFKNSSLNRFPSGYDLSSATGA